jgi:hypothetical protein
MWRRVVWYTANYVPKNTADFIKNAEDLTPYFILNRCSPKIHTEITWRWKERMNTQNSMTTDENKVNYREVSPVHGMRTYSGSRDVTPFIFNLGSVQLTLGQASRYLLNTTGKHHSGSGRLGEGRNLLALPGFKPRTVPPVAQSLYWLRHYYGYNKNKINIEPDKNKQSEKKADKDKKKTKKKTTQN